MIFLSASMVSVSTSCERVTMRVPLPDRLDVYCQGRIFDEAAFLRVVDTTPDQHLNTMAVRDSVLRDEIAQSGGALAYWEKDVSVDMPIAAGFLERDHQRLHIMGVAVVNDTRATSRVYYLEPMNGTTVYRWVDNKTTNDESVCR